MKYIITFMRWPAVGNERFEVEADNADQAKALCEKEHEGTEIEIRGVVALPTGDQA